MRRLLLILVCYAVAHRASAQDKSAFAPMRNQAEIFMDNDVVFKLDEYYTAGQGLSYRRLLKEKSGLFRALQGGRADTGKVILNYNFGTKIYTPNQIRFNEVKKMDRPYAGWSYVSFGIARFRTATTADGLEIEGGLVGEISGMASLQKWWHKTMGFEKPRGWSNQITNEVVVNMNYHFIKEVRLDEDADLITNTGIFAGTGNNKISQDVTLRIFQFNELRESAFFNGALSNGGPRKKEVYLFGGAGVDYVISNILIEGSLFHKPSPVTRRIVPWLFRQNVGFTYSTGRGAFTVDLRFLSREAYGAHVHRYGSFTYSRRF